MNWKGRDRRRGDRVVTTEGKRQAEDTITLRILITISTAFIFGSEVGSNGNNKKRQSQFFCDLKLLIWKIIMLQTQPSNNPSIFIYLQLCLKAQEPKLKHPWQSLKCCMMIHVVLFTEISFNVFLFHPTDHHPANSNWELLLPPPPALDTETVCRAHWTLYYKWNLWKRLTARIR